MDCRPDSRWTLDLRIQGKKGGEYEDRAQKPQRIGLGIGQEIGACFGRLKQVWDWR